MQQLTRRRLRQLLGYDPKSGQWTWRLKKGRSAAGYVAGSLNNYGYVVIRIDGQIYKAHRLAFLYMTGDFPPDQTDHINGDRADNRWCNLRHATNGQNMMNAGLRADSTSGVRGVYPYKDRWRAKIVVDGRQIYVGLYVTKEEAMAARQAAIAKFHGPFGR
jgi:hypothetical protein